MDIQDHTKHINPSGHEVHICHRCGWPFPNLHPSSKHRRAHKRVCGTIEGYTKLLHSDPLSDDEEEKTPSPKIEKTVIKESGSATSGIEVKSNRSEDDLFSDAITEFSDTRISTAVEEQSTDTTKDLVSPVVVIKAEETDIKTLRNSADSQIMIPDSDTKPSVPLVEDKYGSHEDTIDIPEPSNTVLTKENSAKTTDQGEEDVYVLSVPTDIPIVDNAETLIDDFKDHKTRHTNVPLSLSLDGDKDVENKSMVDSFEVKTAEENIQKSQASENGECSMESAVVINEGTVAEIQPLKMNETVTELKDDLSEVEVSPDKPSVATVGENIEKCEHEHPPEVIEKADIDYSVPVLTEAYTQKIVKEPQSGIEIEQKTVESVVADLKDSGKVEISETPENLILEKADQSQNASEVVSKSVLDEGDAKLTTSQDFGVDASIGSSSRNSLEGNWGSVSVLSTASIDAFGGPSMVEPKKEPDQKDSGIKAAKIQNSQPPKPEANVTNGTEGRKRNEEAIAKVKNWSTSEQTNTPLKNLVSEAKASNPTQLSTMIQKDEAADNTGEEGKSNLVSATPTVNQEPSPPKYIGEGKKVRKKTKGIASWVPFVCCSSVNVN